MEFTRRYNTDNPRTPKDETRLMFDMDEVDAKIRAEKILVALLAFDPDADIKVSPLSIKIDRFITNEEIAELVPDCPTKDVTFTKRPPSLNSAYL